MNVYFYSDDGNQRGPVSFDDLKKAGIGKDTLVWRDGFDDWQEAGSVPELRSLFIESPLQTISKPDVAPSHEAQESRPEKSELDNTKMFKNAFLFKGRARRFEFWVAYAIFMLCMVLPAYISESLGDSDVLAFFSVIIILGGIWFFLSEGTRRCHDLGNSGFWMLIPYYILWMLFQNSKLGPNEYGNNPKGEVFDRL
jgi:uncharacterized membrane protein YhaH (DUF805 family)